MSQERETGQEDSGFKIVEFVPHEEIVIEHPKYGRRIYRMVIESTDVIIIRPISVTADLDEAMDRGSLEIRELTMRTGIFHVGLFPLIDDRESNPPPPDTTPQ